MKDKESQKTKTVLITGCSRGIGAATTEKFLSAGWYVIGTSTSGNSAIKHDSLSMVKLDLGSETSIEQCVALLEKQNITLDVLINNAGVNPGIDDEYLSVEKLRQTIEVNLIGLISLTEKVFPLLLPKGRVINLTSSAGNVNNQYIQQSLTPYGIAKAGVNLYTHNLAKRFKDKGLIVLALHPGWVRTDMGSPDAPK
ncbi:MAG: SDR family NAD(P)-dependent oxidoreductase, partial [Rhabdochlamydiaceae bacterium]